MTPSPRPPRLARSILARVVPEDARDSVEGDLSELFVRRRALCGPVSAHVWYWRETLSFSARFAADRVKRIVLATFGRDGAPSALDFKLGGRMLMKYPGLALVGGLGMAVATAIGAGTFAVINIYLYPDLPLHEGERVVTIINWDARSREDNPRILHDFITWRRELKSIVDVGAFRTTRRNLISPTGQGEPIVLAEMSASGFRVAQIPALRGRTLLDADEQPGAAPVVVIGHDVWQTKFDGDPSIIGRPIRLGTVTHTIVGVMPPGFGFPISHSYWIPLHADAVAYEIGKGPELQAFGRLARGATKERASAELAVIGRRAAAANPETHATLQPIVGPFTDIFADGGDDTAWAITIMQAMVVMLLVIVCTNVAVLVYARTVTRTGEIAVRTALGATRARIVTQLFIEAFLLSVVSALLGLGLVAIGLRYFDHLLGFASPTGRAPFWIKPGLSVGTILYTLALAVLGAVIVGVLPALRATGAQLRATLGNLSGGSKAQLGRTWTFLIVTQVAITVAALPPALLKGLVLSAQAMQKPGFAAEEVLRTQLVIERDGIALSDSELTSPALIAGTRAMQTELMTRLTSQAGVVGVTFATSKPGDEDDTRFEIDADGTTRQARGGRVGVNYFDVFGVGVLAGRNFTATDAALASNRPVVVNRSFADEMFGGAAVVGRRIRHSVPNGGDRPWNTIVGVVEDFPTGFKEPGRTNAKVYDLADVGDLQGGALFIRLRGRTPAAFVPTLREVVTAVDPTLQLRRVTPLDVAYAELRRAMFLAALALALTVGSVLLLSTAGIYAMMSFTVNQRRREIGVRAALGADARHILSGILARATRQLAIGAAVGLALSVAVDRLSGGEAMSGKGPLLVPTVAALMVVVGLLAAAGPARRGLRIQPTEALRSD